MAFEDVDATELYPCVMFYSTNPGEKVRTRFQSECVCYLYDVFCYDAVCMIYLLCVCV